MATLKYSVVIPVYKNEETIPFLQEALINLHNCLNQQLCVIFVVDGSPDNCYNMLQSFASSSNIPIKIYTHSRNFGSMAAVRTGLSHVTTEYCAVMAADLQEPPELIIDFFQALEADKADVVIGTRNGREDPFFSKIMSHVFWSLYKKFVVPEIPKGGVDIFGCNSKFRQALLELNESKSSLIALIFWLGFRRHYISYKRNKRIAGKSAWSLSKKIDYMMDSIFAFTNYPIVLLTRVGIFGCIFSLILASLTLYAKVTGHIPVPGYTALFLIILFFSSLNLFALGLVGNYAWRAYENTKQRPIAIVSLSYENITHEK